MLFPRSNPKAFENHWYTFWHTAQPNTREKGDLEPEHEAVDKAVLTP